MLVDIVRETPTYVWLILPVIFILNVWLFRDILIGLLGRFVTIALKLAVIAGALYGLFVFWTLLRVDENVSPMYTFLLLLLIALAVKSVWPRRITANTDIFSFVPRIITIAIVIFGVYAFHVSFFGVAVRKALNQLEEKARNWDPNAPPAKVVQKVVQKPPKFTPKPIPMPPKYVTVPKCRNGWETVELHQSWGDAWWKWRGICVQYRNGSTWFTYVPGTTANAEAYRFCTPAYFGGRKMRLYWSR